MIIVAILINIIIIIENSISNFFYLLKLKSVLSLKFKCMFLSSFPFFSFPHAYSVVVFMAA